jgi:hypothetical protein
MVVAPADQLEIGDGGHQQRDSTVIYLKWFLFSVAS